MFSFCAPANVKSWQRALIYQRSCVTTLHYLSLCDVTLLLQILVGNARYQCSCVRYMTQDNIPLSLCVVTLLLQIMVGNARYQCSCIRYMTQDNLALIVGLPIALAVLLIIIAIIIGIVLYRRRQSRLDKQRDDNETSMGKRKEENQYSRRLPDNYIGSTAL